MTATMERQDAPVITRYDGTRFITEEEIDREFEGKWVLIRLKDGFFHDGHLLASAEGSDESFAKLDDIGILEYGAQTMVIHGCKTRGGNLHVEFLG